jgi:glycosyltransferase involved in cell wall biosynthesis
MNLSVLLPVKNSAATLPACLDSLASQTYPGFEIVCVDHASDDATPRILKAFAARDPRLSVLRSSAPSLPAALNEGLAACRGALIARMDADDLCHPARFERQMALFADDPGLGLAGSGVEFFGEGEVSEGYKN